ARIPLQAPLPAFSGCEPVAGSEAPQRCEVLMLAFVASLERRGLVEQGTSGAGQRRLGEAEQEARLHQARQRPRRIGGDRRVEVVDWRAVERQHSPERALAGVE